MDKGWEKLQNIIPGLFHNSLKKWKGALVSLEKYEQ